MFLYLNLNAIPMNSKYFGDIIQIERVDTHKVD